MGVDGGAVVEKRGWLMMVPEHECLGEHFAQGNWALVDLLYEDLHQYETLVCWRAPLPNPQRASRL